MRRGVALAILLASCGGGEPTDESSSRQAASAQAAPTKTAPTQAAPPARVDAALRYLEAPSDNETAFHGCMRRLNVALRSTPARKDIDSHCLAGTFFGKTYQGESCSLRIAANTGRSSLVRKGNSIELEVPLLRPSTGERSTLDIQWADVEVGHLGMQFRRGGTENRGASETLVVTSGPRDGIKPAGVDEMGYELADAGKVVIVRCRFDA